MFPDQHRIYSYSGHGTQIHSYSLLQARRIDPFVKVENNAELTQLLLRHIRAANETLSFSNFINNARIQAFGIKPVFSLRMRALVQEIALNSTLQELSLRDAKLDGTDLAPLTIYLHTNPSIRTVDLSGSILRDGQSALIRTMLERNIVLQQLNLSSCQMTNGYFINIMEGVTANSTLTHLDLSGNPPIEPIEIDALTRMIQGNNTLTTFLTNSFIKKNPEGVKRLTSALSVNSTLTSLSLRGNNDFEPERLHEFAEVLSNNSTLTQLSIGVQRIHPEGFDSITTALSGNQTLTNFSLSGFGSPLPSGRGIVSILTNNSTLHTLSLSATTVTGPDKYTFEEQGQIKELHNKHPSMRTLTLTWGSFLDFNQDNLTEINDRRRVNFDRLNKTLFELLLPTLTSARIQNSDIQRPERSYYA